MLQRGACIEPYTRVLANRKLHSVISQVRCDVLPLEIETGTWHSIPEEELICKLCTSGLVESEIRFVFYCTLYETELLDFFNCITATVQNFLYLVNHTKLKMMMTEENIYLTAKFIYDIFKKRQEICYLSNITT